MITAELTGSQKAAVLLVQLGRESAAKVLATMEDGEVEELVGEIVKLGTLTSEVTDGVMAEFHMMLGSGPGAGSRGGLEVARHLLEQTLGKARADDLLERVTSSPGRVPFAFLREGDPRQVLTFVAAEHPQTIALVLAHLRPEQASVILAGLDPLLQSDVAHRIAVMDRANPDLVHAVAEVLHKRTSSWLAPVEISSVGGLQPLVEIINRADPGTEKSILEGLDVRDAPLAEQVRSRMFVFDDITGLEDRAVQLVLRQVESNALAIALKGTRQEVLDKVMANVSERARENLMEELELLGRVRLSQVEESRAAIVTVIRALEASGEIVLRRDADDEYVA